MTIRQRTGMEVTETWTTDKGQARRRRDRNMADKEDMEGRD